MIGICRYVIEDTDSIAIKDSNQNILLLIIIISIVQIDKIKKSDYLFIPIP